MTPEQLHLKKAFKETILGVGGVVPAAMFCRVEKSQLQDYYSETKPDKFPPVDVIADLEPLARERSGSPHVLRALSAHMGFVLVRLPEARATGADLMGLLARKVKEGSDVSIALCEALKDGVVRPAEARRVRSEITDLMECLAALNAELAAIEGEGA